MNDYSLYIKQSGLTIYDHIDQDNELLFIPTSDLEKLLEESLVGLSLSGLPLRTRSKFVKSKICQALGYPIPSSFQKTQPRFPGQNFDVYTQKSLNVQIWNEEVDDNRRYIFFRVDQSDVITAVRIIDGKQLASFDRTGTLTQKYQARMQSYDHDIFSKYDTPRIKRWLACEERSLKNADPNSPPLPGQLLPIVEIYRRLKPMVGSTVSYYAAVQERNRGAELHEMICDHLGYSYYQDNGAYPDIANQLLEIKLQTSPTIDLGLHSPEDGASIVTVGAVTFFSNDVRYAIFDGVVIGSRVLLTHLYLVTGEEFSSYFPLFQGKVTNAKIQLPLPHNFFD